MSGRVYKGNAGPGFPAGPARIVVEEGWDTRDLRHVVRHSPTGMNWGYGGSGPSDTALSLLVDALDLDPHNVPDDLPYQQFKFAYVAGWGESWTISQDEILSWYKETQGD